MRRQNTGRPTGRPRRIPATELAQLRVRLSREEMAQLKEIAALEKLTVSQWVRSVALVARGTAQALEAGDVTLAELTKTEVPGQLRIEGT